VVPVRLLYRPGDFLFALMLSFSDACRANPEMKSTFPRKYKARSRTAQPAPRQNLSPGRVTALEPQVKRPNRFNLYVDDHFALGLSLNVAATVRVGQELSRAELEKIAYSEQFEEARERALRFLEVRPRSEQEVRRQLAKKNYPEEIVNRVLERLNEVNLLGDRDFAKYWVENREGFKPRSKRALQYELRQKGVPREAIDRAVKKVDERESAYRAAHAKALRWQSLEAKEFREKLSGFLARRGFDYGVTRETVNRLWQELNGTREEPADDWAPD
jgi:regulatory protein